MRSNGGGKHKHLLHCRRALKGCIKDSHAPSGVMCPLLKNSCLKSILMEKKLELTLKDMSVEKGKLVVKQVNVFMGGEFIRNAEINEALITTIKKGKII